MTNVAVPKKDEVEVAPGVRLAYTEVGSGPPLVFIPGWTLAKRLFAAQLAEFAISHRVFAYDPRSHGISTQTADGNDYETHAQDLLALFEVRGIKRPVVVA